MYTALGLVVAVIGIYYYVQRKKRRNVTKWNEIDESIIKNGASRKKLEVFCQKTVDYILIGSGLGSLTIAALLSKAGFRVLVLEQHDVAGGATHTFEEQAFEFDVGIHYVGSNVGKWHSITRLLFDLITDGALKWSRCDEPYDVAVDAKTGLQVNMSADHTQDSKNISKIFQQDIQAIYRFRRACALARLVAMASFFAKALPKPLARIWLCLIGPAYRWAWCRDTSSVAKACGLSIEAAGCLEYLYGDYGVPPNQAPLALHALLDSHYQGGAYYPLGGAKSIAKTIIAAIHRTSSTSEVFVRAPVTAILTKSNKAIGVTCKDVDIFARRGIISNAGAINTFHHLLLQEKAYDKVQVKKTMSALGIPSEPSVALFFLFVGLEGTKHDLGISGNNLWISQGFSHDENWEALRAAKDQKLPMDDVGKLPTCFLSAGSAKDESHTASTTTVQLLVPVLQEWFLEWKNTRLKHRGADYDALKNQFRDRLLEAFLFRFYPKTKDKIKHTSLASPLTAEFYLNANAGASYGLNHHLERFSKEAQLALHTQTHVSNLFLVGQDHLCVGIVSALISGVLATCYISKFTMLKAMIEALFFL